MQKLYSTENRVLLYLFKSKLAENGIQCLIKNEAPAGPAAGEIPPVIARPELWVLSNEDVTKAKEIIQKELARTAAIKNPWQCPQCKEKLEGQFEVCWKCGYYLT